MLEKHLSILRVEGWRRDTSGNHLERPIEVVAVVIALIRAEADDQSVAPATGTAGAARTLGIVRWQRWDSDQQNGFQLPDIDPHLQRWGCEQEVDLAVVECLLGRCTGLALNIRAVHVRSEAPSSAQVTMVPAVRHSRNDPDPVGLQVEMMLSLCAFLYAVSDQRQVGRCAIVHEIEDRLAHFLLVIPFHQLLVNLRLSAQDHRRELLRRRTVSFESDAVVLPNEVALKLNRLDYVGASMRAATDLRHPSGQESLIDGPLLEK